jgi:hypothetical protein
MSNLAQKLEEVRANRPALVCYSAHHARSPGFNIEFFPSSRNLDEAVGFSSSLLQRYKLEANTGRSADDPPQRLTLAFSTDDVVIYGWNLKLLREHVRDQKLSSVSALSGRYAGAKAEEPWVSKIEIVQVGKLA